MGKREKFSGLSSVLVTNARRVRTVTCGYSNSSRTKSNEVERARRDVCNIPCVSRVERDRMRKTPVELEDATSACLSTGIDAEKTIVQNLESLTILQVPRRIGSGIRKHLCSSQRCSVGLAVVHQKNTVKLVDPCSSGAVGATGELNALHDYLTTSTLIDVVTASDPVEQRDGRVGVTIDTCWIFNVHRLELTSAQGETTLGRIRPRIERSTASNGRDSLSSHFGFSPLKLRRTTARTPSTANVIARHVVKNFPSLSLSVCLYFFLMTQSSVQFSFYVKINFHENCLFSLNLSYS